LIACVASVSVRFGSKDSQRENGARKRRGWGRGRKERKRLPTNPWILKSAHMQNDFTLSSAVMNQPIKSSAFCSGSEL